MSIIDYIANKYCDALAPQCSKRGCRLRLDNFSGYVILKGRMLCVVHKACSYIIFVENNSVIIGIVEFKSRNALPCDIKEKLINCSTAALDILKESGVDLSKYDFYHIVVVKKWRPHEYKILAKMTLTIKGRKYPILLGNNDISFRDLVSSLE